MRCPDCGRFVVREVVHMIGLSLPTPWWWCEPCGKRVEPVE